MPLHSLTLDALYGTLFITPLINNRYGLDGTYRWLDSVYRDVIRGRYGDSHLIQIQVIKERGGLDSD